MKSTSSQGFVLIEAVIATTVCMLVLLGLTNVFNLALKSALANTAKIQAAYLEEEGLEAARLLRDNGWTANIAAQPTGTNLYLNFNAGNWGLSASSTLVDNVFQRTVVFNNVSRDAGQNIVSSGGSNDPNTKKVTVTVSWSDRGVTVNRSLSTYFTNVFNN